MTQWNFGYDDPMSEEQSADTAPEPDTSSSESEDSTAPETDSGSSESGDSKSSELPESEPGEIGDDKLPEDLQPTEDNPLARHPAQTGDDDDKIGAEVEGTDADNPSAGTTYGSDDDSSDDDKSGGDGSDEDDSAKD